MGIRRALETETGKQRGNVIKNVMSSIENVVNSHNTSMYAFTDDNANHTQATIERTRDEVVIHQNALGRPSSGKISSNYCSTKVLPNIVS